MKEAFEDRFAPVLEVAKKAGKIGAAVGGAGALFVAGVAADRMVYADPQINELIADNDKNDCSLTRIKGNTAQFLCHTPAGMTEMVRRNNGNTTNSSGLEVDKVDAWGGGDAFDVTIKDPNTK